VSLLYRLDLTELVSAYDEKAPRMRADALICLRCEFDQLIALEAGALTAKCYERVFLSRPKATLDGIVDLTKDTLIGRYATL
jgi:hypothetical protein